MSAPVRATGVGGGRPPLLCAAVDRLLLAVWKQAGRPAGLYLTAMLQDLPAAAPGHIAEFSEDAARQLLAVSASTIKRSLQRQDTAKPGGKTRPASDCSKQVRGCFEVLPTRHPDTPHAWVDWDTVFHCGGDLRGAEYAWTLNGVETTTGWAYSRTVLRSRRHGIVHAITELLKDSPIPFDHAHMDNGGEFINREMVKVAALLGFSLSRSRPGKANDNCLVEQANYHRIRRLFACGRYEEQEIEQMNKVNEINMLIINLFTVRVKLVSKQRCGAKVKRVYDQPQTPLQRVIAHYRRHNLPLPAKVRELIKLKKTLNIFQLHKELNAALRQLHTLRARRIKEEKKKGKIRA